MYFLEESISLFSCDGDAGPSDEAEDQFAGMLKKKEEKEKEKEMGSSR